MLTQFIFVLNLSRLTAGLQASNSSIEDCSGAVRSALSVGYEHFNLFGLMPIMPTRESALSDSSTTQPRYAISCEQWQMQDAHNTQSTPSGALKATLTTGQFG